MTAYLIAFFCSSLMMKLSDLTKKKYLRVAFVIIAILILSVIAGIRDFNIGTDVRIYVVPDFLKAKSHMGNFIVFFTDRNNGMELVYMIIQYLCAMFFNTAHSTLFILSLFTNLFIYLGISSKKLSSFPTWAVWLLYCFLFFNPSLNTMRQALAQAIIFYIFANIDEMKLYKMIIFFVLAMLNHSSAIIGILIFAIYLLSKKEFIRRPHFKILLISLIALIPFLLQKFLSIAISLGVVSSKFALYFTLGTQRYIDGQTFMLHLFFAILFFLYSMQLQKNQIESEEAQFYEILVLLDLLFPLISYYLTNRVAMYIAMFELLYVPKSLSIYSKKSGGQFVVTVIVLFAAAVYWYVRFMLLNYNETFPYKIGLF